MKLKVIRWEENKTQYSNGERGYVGNEQLFYLNHFDVWGKIILSTDLPISHKSKFETIEQAKAKAQELLQDFVEKLII